MTDAARILFAAQGFQLTKMADISAAAGIKVGQIYRDFESKEAIVADIVRADLVEWLDEPVLDRLVRDGDPGAVRRWISQFIRHDCSRTQSKLRAQIFVEATHNEQIADLLRLAAQRVSISLHRALTSILPHGVSRRAELVETIMVLMIGLSHRQFVMPDIDPGVHAASMSALVEREIDRLLAVKDRVSS